MGPLQWGDVPTWVGGTGALAAAWYAYRTITSQRQQIGEQREFIGEQLRFMNEQRQNLELERAELHAVAEDRRWAQARRVHMHHLMGSTPGPDGVAVEDTIWFVVLANKSDAPVHQVDVRFGTAYAAAEVHEWNLHRGSPAFEPGEPIAAPVHLVGPMRGVRFTSLHWSPATVYNNRPTVYFTDNSGVRWSLDSHGKLEEARADRSS